MVDSYDLYNSSDSDVEIDSAKISKAKQLAKPLISNEIENIDLVKGIYVPWTEKYRPQTPDELVVGSSIKNKIKKIISDRNMPNIIITGIPGIGKTTTIQCIAFNILGKYIKDGLLELNASDDRGIKAVQEAVTFFCKKKVDFADNNNIYAKHKIVLLDEADNMTEKAQRLVNELMEKHKNTTRFAFTCNTSSKIIESIQSKCIILRYKRLSNNYIEKRLTYIAKKENIKFTKIGITSLAAISQGDLRQAVSSLQVMHINYPEINQLNVFKIYDKPEILLVNVIFTHMQNKNFIEALKLLTDLRNKGYTNADIIYSMLFILKTHDFITISEQLRILYIKNISKTYFYIYQGINSDMQLDGCIAKLCST